MDDASYVNVRRCGGGRVHLQIGFLTVCLDPAQIREVASAAQEVVDRIEAEERTSTRWKALPQ